MRKGDEEEIEVEEELELLVKDDGQEGEYIVLLVADNVGRKLALQLVFPNVVVSGCKRVCVYSTHLVVVKERSEICPLALSATSIAVTASP